MTTYNTGNPIGSTDARDLYDNAQNLDNFSNGSAASYTDRLGVIRRSLAGIEATADGVLNGIGYQVPVAYASGISLTLTSQTVDYNGVIYAPKASALPFTTSSWGADSIKFRAVQVTDADLITYTPAGTGAVATTVQSKLRETVSVKDFGAVGDGVADDTAAIQKAIDSLVGKGGQIYFPPGDYYLSSPISITQANDALTLTGPARGRGASAVQAAKLTCATTAITAIGTGLPVYGLCIQNLTIRANSGSHDHLIKMDYVYSSNLINVLISGTASGKDNLQLTNAADVTITELVIAGAGRYGVNIGDAVATNASTTIRFRGGYLRNCKEAAIWGIGADQMSTLIIDGTAIEANGRDESLSPIAGAVGAGVVLENTTNLVINGYFEANTNADIVLGGTIDSAGTITTGVQCKNSCIDGFFYGLGGSSRCKYGVVLVNAVSTDINGEYSLHDLAEVKIQATLKTDVIDAYFNRMTYGVIPSGFVNDNWNRVSPIVAVNNLMLNGDIQSAPINAVSSSSFGAVLGGSGIRLPGITGTSGLPTLNGYEFFNTTYNSRGLYVVDGYYYEQNQRHIVYGATAHTGTLPSGYGKYTLRPNGSGQSVAVRAGLYAGDVVSIFNASDTNSITVTGTLGSNVVIAPGKGVYLSFDEVNNAWLSTS